ncbi:hypothetical protein F0562_018589 [Nyssa sinensis]|uniref:Uncharacterized protein n=1 Tax=Nyssa sinensis TaxID=561372 RepID=A0A5J4ZBK4_9ASTE|nr:hypothetical protein F0562_018589 [Nyssa sinensis]
MAHVWHDCGDIWFYCPLQWLLANTGCLSTEVAHSWLGASTTICDIVPWTEQRQTSTSMRILGQSRSKESEKTALESLCIVHPILLQVGSLVGASTESHKLRRNSYHPFDPQLLKPEIELSETLYGLPSKAYVEME